MDTGNKISNSLFRLGSIPCPVTSAWLSPSSQVNGRFVTAGFFPLPSRGGKVNVKIIPLTHAREKAYFVSILHSRENEFQEQAAAPLLSGDCKWYAVSDRWNRSYTHSGVSARKRVTPKLNPNPATLHVHPVPLGLWLLSPATQAPCSAARAALLCWPFFGKDVSVILWANPPHKTLAASSHRGQLTRDYCTHSFRQLTRATPTPVNVWPESLLSPTEHSTAEN